MIAALAILPVLAFSQNTTKQHARIKKQKIEVKYDCPMHPEVTSKKPGKCSKCGMDLVKIKKEKAKVEMAKMYTCPMHAEVTSDKPGKCPKCNMDLIEKEADHSNHQH